MNLHQTITSTAAQLAMEWPNGSESAFAHLFAQTLNATHAILFIQTEKESPHWMLPIGHHGFNDGEETLLFQSLMYIREDSLLNQACQQASAVLWTRDHQHLSHAEQNLMHVCHAKTLVCSVFKLTDGCTAFLYALSPIPREPDLLAITHTHRLIQALIIGWGNHVARTNRKSYNDHLSKVLDLAPELFLVAQNHTITNINQSSFTLLGYQPEEMIGRDYRSFVHPEDLSKTTHKGVAVQNGQTVVRFRNRYLHKKGHVVHLEWAAFDVNGEEVGFARDITEHICEEQSLMVFRRIIDQAPDPMILTCFQEGSSDHLGLIYVNEVFCKQTGYTELDFGSDLQKLLFLITDADTASSIMQNLQQGILAEFSFLAHTRNRQRMWLALAPKIIQDCEAGVDRCLITLKDITTQKMYEESLLRNYQVFEEVFQHNPLPMWIYDVHTLHFLEVNQAAQHKYGYTREEFLNLTLKDIRPPEEAAKLEQSLQKIRQAPYVVPDGNVSIHQTRDGRKLMVEISSYPMQYKGRPARMVIPYDITVRDEYEQRIRQSEHTLQLVTENMRNVICYYDHNFIKQYVSPSCVHVFGYTPQEMLEKTMEVVHPDDREEYMDHLRVALKNHQAFTTVQLRCLHQKGHTVWVESHIKFLRDEQQQLTGMVTATVDITERQQAHHELVEALVRTRELVDLTIDIEKAGSLQDIIEHAIHYTLKVLPFNQAYFLHLHDQGFTINHMVNVSSSGLHERIEEHMHHLRGSDHRRQLRRGTMVYHRETREIQPFEAGMIMTPEQVVLCPVNEQGRLYGLIILGNEEQESYVTATAVDFIHAMRDRITLAVERNQHVQELYVTREETLRTLGLALEYRDYETKGHTDRVVHLSQSLGMKMGLSADELDALRWGAYLHDTGKMAIPDHILLKPGRLTPEEFQQVKKHSEIGFDLLKNIPTLPADVLEVVLHHHERWDGTGYPLRLKYRDIPKLARIFSVLDVYDALVSERPYKKPMPHQEAMQEIERCSGSMFDPEVVEAFRTLFD
ncbi:PAS domain S-box protein [Deinococcus misasensis]|uniref:PAS domain S-box protein n=1 Tax=Deinococcus misasensis TaxID=392413 RepID=UPI00068D3DDA|nr:PAS domain S-box protein [Deinococcus misasensis]